MNLENLLTMIKKGLHQNIQIPAIHVGTSAILKISLYSNQYYNRKKIYWEFIHVKYILCHIPGMISGFSRLGEIRAIVRIAYGNHFYQMI